MMSPKRRPKNSKVDAMRPGTEFVRFTNTDKILWPEDAISKGQLIEYYHQVADYLIPYLRDRPLSLHRFPDGIAGKSFFQKDKASYMPDWIETIDIPSENKKRGQLRYVVCNDRRTLLYLANLASIELHPWLSQRGTLDHPDWAILDLDPSEADFRHVKTIAQTTGNLLRDIGIRPSLKTSGAKGLHVYIPLLPKYSYEQSRMFCEGVAQLVVERHPQIATLDRAKSRRRGKVYLDYLQNRRGQTVVAPYVVRPEPGATVSAPLDWDELDDDLHPSGFHLGNIPARIEELGDLFAATLTDRQDLIPAINALLEHLSG